MPTPQQKTPAPDFIPADPDFIPADGGGAATTPSPTPQMSNQPHGAPGNIFTSGHPLETLRANYDEGARPSNASDGGVFGRGLHDIGRGFTETLAGPIVHPWDTIKGIGGTIKDAVVHSNQFDPDNPVNKMVGSTVQDFQDNGAASAIPHLAGQIGGGMIAGEIVGPAIKSIPKMASAARTAAIGDTDAAALRGMRVPANGKKVLPMQRSVQMARPYLQGADSLEDLQSKVKPAQREIYKPVADTLDAVGDTPIQHPDGSPTTLKALEDERQQLSAMNRGLKTGDPAALQLAQQKGLTQADALAREKAIQGVLDPALSRYGIDPQGIRQAYGAVSRVGNQVEGRSTLLEKPQPSGFGKMADISLKNPKSWFGQPLAGMRDLIAGRPLMSASPSDLGIREGFANAGPKPNFGQYTPFKPTGLLDSPSIELGAPPEVYGPPAGYRPPNFYHDTDAMRMGRLLKAPPIELGGRVDTTPPPPFHFDTTPMRMGRILEPPIPDDELPSSYHTEEFPDQLPSGTRVRPKTIEGKK